MVIKERTTGKCLDCEWLKKDAVHESFYCANYKSDKLFKPVSILESCRCWEKRKDYGKE